MKISACVIVKNEEKNIARWLDNMRQIADEIIVVDTGSTDSTLDILRKVGVKPYHFAWCSDFAAAKNYAIKQATGDWIVFLDADEYFDEPSLKCFRREVAKYHRNKKIGAVMCQLVNIDADNNNRIIGAIIQVRLFRNNKYIYYKNPVHEQLVTTPGKYIMQKCFTLQIIHTGYSASIVRKKAERDLPILQQRDKSAKTRKEKEQLYTFFMDAYNCLGVYDKVLEYAQKAADSDMKTLGSEIHIYECMISAMAHLGKDDKEIMAVIKDAKKKFPREVFFATQLGYYCYVSRDFLKAERYMLEAVHLREQAEQAMRDGIAVSDNSLNLVPLLYGMLADISLRKNQRHRALELALKGLEYYKYTNLLVQSLYKSLQGRPVEEIIQVFDCLYDRHKDGDFLLETLNWQVEGKFAAYYCTGKSHLNRARLYLKVAQYKGAAADSGMLLTVLNHAALAAKWRENSIMQIDSVDSAILAIMPSKYKGLWKNTDGYRQDIDGRAAMRIVRGIEDGEK